jgi:hypothetical protein
VTAGAPLFPEEDRLTGRHVAIDGHGAGRGIQTADERCELPHLIVGECEWGHARSFHSVSDGCEKIAILGAADLPACDEIRPLAFSLSALAIPRVAPRTELKKAPPPGLYRGAVFQ